MQARPFIARYVAPSGARRVPIQFFATSHKEALRLAKRKAGKGLLYGLSLARVEALYDEAAGAPQAKAA